MIGEIVVTQLFDIMTIPIIPGIKRQISNRKGYGISFCETPGGKIVYIHNGCEYISDYNHAILLPKDQTYMLYGISNGKFPLIDFQCQGDSVPKEFQTFDISNDDSYNFLHTYSVIKEYQNYKSAYYYFQTMSLFYQMIGNLDSTTSDSRQRNILEPAIQYMNEHFTDPSLSISDLAEQVNLSPCYFRRLFHKEFAMSPKQYVIQSRINKAKGLLLSSCWTISSISEECGFNSIYHFSRIFRSYVGCTPSDYIKRYARGV